MVELTQRGWLWEVAFRMVEMSEFKDLDKQDEVKSLDKAEGIESQSWEKRY